MRSLSLAAALLLLGCFGESAPVGDGDSSSSGGACAPGFQGCACYGNETCEVGLVCIVEADECIPEGCTPGEIGCTCSEGQCFGAGMCAQGVCEPPQMGTGDATSAETTSTSTGDPTTSTTAASTGESATGDDVMTTGDGPCAAAMEGDACESGTCHEGACCTGCWDGRVCQLGTADAACGQGGNECTVCAGGMCVQGAPCGSSLGIYPNVCMAGSCVQSDALGCCPVNACNPKSGCQ